MTSNTIGAAPTLPAASVTDGKNFGLGDRYTDDDGNEFVYVQANGAITGAGYICVIDETYQAAMVSTSNDALGDLLGVPLAAWLDNDYGWLQVKGPTVVRVAASAAANTRLNTTATAGQLDDDNTSGSFIAANVWLTTANGGSAATAAAMLLHPYIGNTVPGVAYAATNSAGIIASLVALSNGYGFSSSVQVTSLKNLLIDILTSLQNSKVLPPSA